MIIRE